MEEKQLTEQESLMIIQQMINTAKVQQKDNGKGWIIWGWLLFLASVSSYINIQKKWFEPYIFWNIFGGISAALLLYSFTRFVIFKKRSLVKTYTGELFQKLNTGFSISLLFIILAINRGVGVAFGFGLLVNLYAFWILIYGTALNFKPSIVGAFLTWAFGVAILFTTSFASVMLLHAAAVLCGYIIPGHIAFRAFKKVNPS
jgi:hypothetical protein